MGGFPRFEPSSIPGVSLEAMLAAAPDTFLGQGPSRFNRIVRCHNQSSEAKPLQVEEYFSAVTFSMSKRAAMSFTSSILG